MPRRGPTIRLRRMGIELRRIREAQGLTLDTAGDLLGRSGSSLSKIENGLIRLWPRELEQILDRYAIHDRAIRTWLIALSIEGRKKGWWKEYKGIADPAMLDYVSLEAAATRLRAFEPTLIPGLVQTEEYARTVITTVPPVHPSCDTEPFVTLRMNRQRLLTKENPPIFHAIIGEAALHQLTGGLEVMIPQLALLEDLTEVESIKLQVVPFAAGAHAGADGPFWLLDVHPELRLAFTSHPLGSVYSDQDDKVNRCTVIFNSLCEVALSQDESRALIADRRRILMVEGEPHDDPPPVQGHLAQEQAQRW